MVRHFLLAVETPAQARRQLGRLVSGDESDAPQITTAADWHVGFAPGPGDDPAEPRVAQPDYCLNVGITWPGLVALEVEERVPTLSFKSFGAFIEGAAQRAESVGDTGASSPENWVGGFGSGHDHVLVTLHAISPEAMEELQRQAVRLVGRRRCLSGDLAPGRDGVDGDAGRPTRADVPRSTSDTPTASRTPTIRGGPEQYRPDHQQPCEPWLFVLREDAVNYELPEPRELGLNGSFAVFKKVETDVVGFEDFLQSNKDRIDPELLAAKMCGRWRNGVPLALSPDTDSPAGGIAPEQLNDFGYVDADGSGDPKGIALPRRRAHTPRQSTRSTGRGPGGARRQQQLPPADSSRPAVRADLRPGRSPTTASSAGCSFSSSTRTSRTSTSSCCDSGSTTASSPAPSGFTRSRRDPLIGTQDPAESIFVIPQANGAPPIEVTGLSSFVTTKAAAYMFLPSITAIKFIADLGEGRDPPASPCTESNGEP